jgi:hypothetical protein
VPDELPDEPAQPSTPPSRPATGGFFPSTDEDADLPAVEAPDAELPPADTDRTAPPDPFEQPPSGSPTESQPDDVFDLDDFGGVDPHRLRRYRLSSTKQLRAHGTAARTRSARSAPREQVQLATYRQPDGRRRNPLRTWQPAEQAPPTDSAPRGRVEPTAWTSDSIELHPIEEVVEPEVVDSIEPARRAEPQRSTRVRSNPLR